MQTIFEGMMIVEKKMYSKSGFYFVYSEEVKFTNRDEFLETMKGHHVVFLSHTDESLAPLLDSDAQKEAIQEKNLKIIHLSKPASVIQAIHNFDSINNPNGIIFILSVKKEESKNLFEMMIEKGINQNFLLLVENIT